MELPNLSGPNKKIPTVHHLTEKEDGIEVSANHHDLKEFHLITPS